MVTQQGCHSTTSGSGFALQAHHQIQHSNTVRSAIDKIAHKPERCCTCLPCVLSIYQIRILQELDKLFQVAMHIANNIGRSGGWDLHQYSLFLLAYCNGNRDSPPNSMPRLFKHSYCAFQVLFLYEQVVSLIGCEGKDADIRLSKWNCKRDMNPCH